MSNELLWFLAFIVDFVLLLLTYRHLGKTGLYSWIVLMTVLANMQVQKTIEIFGITATLGNIAYASIFLATDILSEHYGKHEAKLAVLLGFFTMLISAVVMAISLWFTPGPQDTANPALRQIFLFLPRIGAASLVAYFISQFHDICSYHFWKNRLPGIKYLWIRNNFSTLVSQLLDTLVFTTIAFWGRFPRETFLSIMLSTYLIKAATAILDTPFIYAATWMHQKGLVKER